LTGAVVRYILEITTIGTTVEQQKFGSDSMQKYKASLSRSNGREFWSIIFRHPVRLDGKGKYGLRIRRGLGTSDKEQAEILVEQMNEILADETLWIPAARSQAIARNYNEIIIRAFYDDLEETEINFRQLRNSQIALPQDKQYRSMLILGATGVGKTTFLRQLMGTYSKTDRFPTTSAGRTTTCDMEVICASQDNFEGVVTFLTRTEVRTYVEECIQAAIHAKLIGTSEEDVVQRFILHKDQRFRLNYILGDLSLVNKSPEGEFDFFDDEIDEEDQLEEDEIEEINTRLEMSDKLRSYLSRINDLTVEAETSLTQSFELEKEELSNGDKQALRELIVEEYLEQNTGYLEIIDDLMDDIQNRLSQLQGNGLIMDSTDWAVSYYFNHGNKKEFLKKMRLFSSNHKDQWGRLLTPIVEGMRLRGPFKPDGYAEVPKLILYDGEGIGHSSDSETSLPDKVTDLFGHVQAILLVDKGDQPMVGPSRMVIKSVVISGHIRKLLLCFTHMDAVKGDSMKKGVEKVNHVKASINTALNSLNDGYGRSYIASLEQLLKESSFFFFKMQAKMVPASSSQLTELIDHIFSMNDPEDDQVPKAELQYHFLNLSMSIQNAIKEFHEKWDAILGLGRTNGIKAEHWTRVRALSKRLALLNHHSYDTLKPISDFIELLQDHLAQFITKPKKCEPEEIKDIVTEKIKQEVYSQLHQIAPKILLADNKQQWKVAFNYTGRGSATLRAKDIQEIYQGAAPIFGETPREATDEFKFQEMMNGLVEEIIRKYDGELLTFRSTNNHSA
jgi:energy-coupling factor transporter ATP-binding protein EcfA2